VRRLLVINVYLAMAVAIAGKSLAAEQGPGAVYLREVIEISHPGPVLLSDLLPPNAPSAIRNASMRVELCRAPQPGSLRILQAEQVRHSITEADLLQRLIIPARVTIRCSARLVSETSAREAISDFLRKHGWESGLAEGSKLDLPDVAAANCEPFEVMHLRWDLQRQAIEVHLGCSKPRSCGGSLGYVLLPQTMPEDSRNGLIRAISTTSAHPLRKVLSEVAPPPLLAKGKTATLILENTRMRISVPVICLEPGLLNEEIHVFDQRSRRVFRAQVIGDHLLRANL
jgi:hypothetical protein